jgi:hypothetical protein
MLFLRNSIFEHDPESCKRGKGRRGIGIMIWRRKQGANKVGAM